MNSFDYTIVARNGYYYAILDGGEVIGAYLTVGALIADNSTVRLTDLERSHKEATRLLAQEHGIS